MKNLLILEEDGEGRETLARILKRRGFHVLTTVDEASALLALSSGAPIDVVIAGATDRDRGEFLSDLHETRPDLPIIFLSDYCAPESRLRSLQYGPFSVSRRLNFYINTRPVGFHELERMIRIVLAGRRPVRQAGLAAA